MSGIPLKHAVKLIKFGGRVMSNSFMTDCHPHPNPLPPREREDNSQGEREDNSGKIRETLPLEGEGKGWGCDKHDRCGQKAQEILHGYRAVFMAAHQRSADGRFQVSSSTSD